jgi:predicted transcriptional regulator
MSSSYALPFAVGIVTSFVKRNEVAASDLPGLIQTVHRAIATIGNAEEAPAEEQRKASPAQIRRSITPEALISFEDGKPYRLLKRHLKTHDLTPEQYRVRWGLPADYPMVAPAYAEKRREFARAIGLGRTTRGKSQKGQRSRSSV